MAASGVLIQSLGNGVLWDSFGNALNNHQVFVYQRGTTTQVQVYSNATLSTVMSQPLMTGNNGAAPGGIPGYVAGEQEIDLFDSTTSTRVPAEPVGAADLIGSDGKVGGPSAPVPLTVNVVQDSSGNGTVDWSVVKEAPLNVQWAEYGAPGIAGQDSAAAINTAVARAAGASGSNNLNVSGSGEIYLPPGVYDMISANGITTTNPVGLTIKGAGPQSTMIRSKASGSPIAIDINGGASSGAANKVSIRDLMVMYQAGSSGATAIRIWDTLWFSIVNCEIYANGCAVSVQGSGVGTIRDSQLFVSGPTAGPIAALWVGSGSSSPNAGDGTLTASGPLVVDNCQVAAGGCPAAILDTNSFSFRAQGCQFGATGAAATVTIDGTYTSATFEDCHGESDYNTSNNGVDFLIGSHVKPISVAMLNPIFWGHGNGTNFQKYAIDIAACKNLRVENGTWSKLTATHGYDSGIFHLQTGYPASGDQAKFSGNTKDTVTGPLYADANSIIPSTWTGDYTFQSQLPAGITQSVAANESATATAGSIASPGNFKGFLVAQDHTGATIKIPYFAA